MGGLGKLLCKLDLADCNQYKRHSTAPNSSVFPVLKWHHKGGLVLEYTVKTKVS